MASLCVNSMWTSGRACREPGVRERRTRVWRSGQEGGAPRTATAYVQPLSNPSTPSRRRLRLRAPPPLVASRAPAPIQTVIPSALS